VSSCITAQLAAGQFFMASYPYSVLSGREFLYWIHKPPCPYSLLSGVAARSWIQHIPPQFGWVLSKGVLLIQLKLQLFRGWTLNYYSQRKILSTCKGSCSWHAFIFAQHLLSFGAHPKPFWFEFQKED
jgi:hypothetical protein